MSYNNLKNNKVNVSEWFQMCTTHSSLEIQPVSQYTREEWTLKVFQKIEILLEKQLRMFVPHHPCHKAPTLLPLIFPCCLTPPISHPHQSKMSASKVMVWSATPLVQVQAAIQRIEALEGDALHTSQAVKGIWTQNSNGCFPNTSMFQPQSIKSDLEKLIREFLYMNAQTKLKINRIRKAI